MRRERLTLARGPGRLRGPSLRILTANPPTASHTVTASHWSRQTFGLKSPEDLGRKRTFKHELALLGKSRKDKQQKPKSKPKPGPDRSKCEPGAGAQAPEGLAAAGLLPPSRQMSSVGREHPPTSHVVKTGHRGDTGHLHLPAHTASPGLGTARAHDGAERWPTRCHTGWPTRNDSPKASGLLGAYSWPATHPVGPGGQFPGACTAALTPTSVFFANTYYTPMKETKGSSSIAV